MHRTKELSVHVVLFDGERWHVNLVEDTFEGPRRSTRLLSRVTFTNEGAASDYIRELLAQRMTETAGRRRKTLPAAAGPRETAGKAGDFTA